MENELISKSFGPFLRKRMDEEKVYTPIDPVTPSKDKRARARSIQGRMQQGKVHFPRYADWWPAAKRSEEHTSELQSLMRISYAVFCLKKKTQTTEYHTTYTNRR